MASHGNSTARLRRTFQYPNDDSDDDSQFDAMDEQEQEAYIERLAAENKARDVAFTTYLLAFPVVSTLPYLLSIFRPATMMISILALTSLASTAYLLRVLPPAVTGLAPIDAWSSAGVLAGGLRSPIDTHLPYLNAGLVIMLGLMELVTSMKPSTGPFWFGMGYLPGIVFGVVTLSKFLMAGVDPEKELTGLRYEYRGA